MAISAYLIVVLLGPLSNPVASENLTRPLAQTVSPVHQAMFLGHGYRFFGPDPGPSHIIEYKIDLENGESVTGIFPDRDHTWPRLLYHRWFMLSEKIFEDHSSLLSDKDYAELIKELDAEIESSRMRNETTVVRQLILQRDRVKQDHEYRKARSQSILQHLANHLLSKYCGTSVELFQLERLIASPAQVASRIKIDDERFLSLPRSLGTFRQEKTADLEAIQ